MEQVYRRERVLGAVLTAISCLAFHLLYWNRFLAMSCSGTAIYPADLILRGAAPYRDFFLIIPPLSILKDAALMRLFGHTVQVLRLDAVIERVSLGVLVYWWLSRFFRYTHAFLGVLVCIVFFAADTADALISYHHDSVFLAVAGAYCAARFISLHGRKAALFGVGAGLAAGACFMTAQTVGGGITVCLPVMVLFIQWQRKQWKRGAEFLAVYISGWAASAGSVTIWLASNQALGPFVRCVFLGTTAKGATSHILLRPFVDRFGTLIVATVVLLMLATAMGMPRRGGATGIRIVALFSAACCALAAALALAARNWQPGRLSYEIELLLMAGTISGCLLIAIYLLSELAPGKARLFDDELLILTAAGFSTAYTLSLSFAYFGAMVMPGLALLIAIGLNGLERRPVLRLTCTAALLCCVSVETVAKIELPFDFMLWPEGSALAATYRSAHPTLQGLLSSVPTGPIADQITELIREHAPPGGTLFVYPYFPMFYVMTGLRPPTYGYLHYLDVAPDWLCERDAKTLVERPPSVIVRLVESEQQLAWSESLYRGKQISGTRKIIAAMDQLAPQYRVLGSFALPGYGASLEVLGKQ